jgi:hypothetical protein
MRTKVLLGLAALAAGAVTATAQNVYSLNVVGYINLPLIEGFNLVANQLDADGTGTNNTVAGVFSTNLPTTGLGTSVYLWDPAAATYNIATYAVTKGVAKWNHDFPWNPGQGAWVSIPVNAFGGAGKTGTVTTVGTVLQGSLVNKAIPAAGGYTIVASQIPLSGGITTALGYQPKLGDVVQAYDPVSQTYTPATYANVKGNTGWKPAEPSLAVGQAVWLNAQPGDSWTTNFTIQ